MNRSGRGRRFFGRGNRHFHESNNTTEDTNERRKHPTSQGSSEQGTTDNSKKNDSIRRGGSQRYLRYSQGTSYRTDSNNTHRNKNDNMSNRMGFKLAEKIGENNDSEEIIQDLLNDRKGFKEVLKDSELSGDWLVLIIHILTKVCECSFIDSKINIFQTVFIHSTYSKQLTRFISDIPNHNNIDKRKNSYFWKDTDKFWNDLLIIFEEITRLPSFACQSLPTLLKSIKRVFPAIQEEHGLHISDGIVENFDILLKKIQNMKSEYVINQVQQYINDGDEFDDDKREPPNDFREIKIYPTVIEVTTKEQPFLRKNKVKGSYEGIPHYLDVQFRLLREDFLAPLRRGICQYLDDPNRKKFDDVKIHRKVQFISKENVNELNCVKIKYDFSNKKKPMKYENSKQFMYGSLVCFTRDRFKSLIFGKIVKRDIALLKQGELVVGFDEHEDISFEIDYIMVESSVYFEPYYQVLTALQRMSSDVFPMERYIIYAEATTHHPNYLHEDTVYTIQNKQLNPLNWPNHEKFYGLNDSQQKAFRASLTEEIAVIQGPPGTGKTFLGLKIACTLLKNQQAWYKHSPMLVICFTNHALDQFLEGILPFTKKLLRIGGQSKNNNLDKYNLRNGKTFKKSSTFYQIQRDLKTCLNDLKQYDDILSKIKQCNCVVDFSYFDGVVPNFNETWFSRATREDIKHWLLEEVKNTVNDNKEPLFFAKEQLFDNEIHAESEDELSPNEDSDDEKQDIDEIYKDILVFNFKPLLSLESIMSQIKFHENMLDNLYCYDQDGSRRDKCEKKLLTLKREYIYLQSKLKYVRTTLPEILNPNIPPHLMTPKQRWALYSIWLKQYYEFLKNKREKIYTEYKEKHKIYSDQRCIEDVKIMKENLVIGMTTTGAARLRSSLEALKSPIVIVEEAAEVLEAHIISTLTVHCKHLILIGDHQQLKPSTADYKIETVYLLGTSLFERMVNNNLQCYTLNTQHRMKPEICDLIRPDIYPELIDHVSVMDRPNIRGIDKCLFFINHDSPENICNDASKKNIHEAKFLINLARYFILNGYEPKQITILAAYLGQMFEMQRERKKYSELLNDMRIAVLDNYQGEESDIILLSLVRNNKEGKIGFLKITNRVCVALSRAKNGLYIMGNMELLCKHGVIWPQIKQKLQQHDALGTSLALRCQIHHTITEVKCEEDFTKVSEGGCNLMCNAKLLCNHFCKNICHLRDRDHNNYSCMEACERKPCERMEEHICKKRCFQDCGPCNYPVDFKLGCGHTCTLPCHIDEHAYKCIVPVSIDLSCGHVADKPCNVDSKLFACPHPCDTRVDPCGHACTLKCHVKNDPDHLMYKCKKQCQKKRAGCTLKGNIHICRKLCHEECELCEINVKKKRTVCSHLYKVPCNSNVDDLICEKPCTKILPCGHKCKNKCCESCGPCNIQVVKTITECGHNVKVKCFEKPERKLCNKNCTRTLICGHNCNKKCKEECTTKCVVKRVCNLTGPCGHIVKEIPCYRRIDSGDPHLLKHCTEPCTAVLKCNHKCKGTCGECFQGRIHARCREKCGVFLVCNHECPIPCREACKPCEKKCSFRCIHSSCKRKCGEVCISCREQCPRNCVHQKCNNCCGDICSVGPCEKPCPKILKCGHPCIGFCNDPCPQKCRICNEDEITEIFFGGEDQKDSRFVELQDCKHILESTGMEVWLNQGDQIQIKVCPMCKTPIINTQRYSDHVKRAILDVHNVKERLIGTSIQNNERRAELLGRIVSIKAKSSRLSSVTVFGDVVMKLEGRLQHSRQLYYGLRRQQVNGLVLNSITSKIQILEYVLDLCCTKKGTFISTEIDTQIKFILEHLMRDEDQITVQEIEDIECEIDRLKRIVEIFQIKNMRQNSFLGLHFPTEINNSDIEIIQQQVIHFKKYTKEIDSNVQNKLKMLNSRVQISDSERKQIVKALGLSNGHWFKCPNGHPYVITECGGAMQESRCPECGEKIGGTQHRLLSTNRLASEMDGARLPAWPQTANDMNNYEF